MSAGTLYFAGIFAAGFFLGAIRQILLVPGLGETLSVVIELPVILAIGWLLSLRIVVRTGVSGKVADRAFMGLTAFVLLMIAEFLLWIWLFGEPALSFFSRYAALSNRIGLAGQVIFAAIPVIQRVVCVKK